MMPESFWPAAAIPLATVRIVVDDTILSSSSILLARIFITIGETESVQCQDGFIGAINASGAIAHKRRPGE